VNDVVVTGRSWKAAGLVAGVAAGLAVTGVGVFFGVTGVDNANRWSGVLGFFVGALGLAVSIYIAMLTRRLAVTPTVAPPTGDNVDNTIRGGTFHQPAVQARDISGLSIGSPVASPASPPPAASTGSGDVHNTISGGTFGQSVVQARDISGLSLSTPATPPTVGNTTMPPSVSGPTV
jgi:hypothetical protein